MSEDVSDTTIPDEPSQDPDAVDVEPSHDDHGFTDDPHSGYDLGHEAPSIPSDPNAHVGTGDPESDEPADG